MPDMFTTQRHSSLSPAGFLERAVRHLESGIDVAIFYTALDLRFCFESILIKHGFASLNDTNTFLKLKSKPSKLHDRLREEFADRIDIDLSYRFSLDPDKPNTNMGYFLAIPDDLFANYGKLDNYLHAQWAIPIRDPSQDWCRAANEFLHRFSIELIPHASPDNSLDFISIPRIEYVEMSSGVVATQLKTYWS